MKNEVQFYIFDAELTIISPQAVKLPGFCLPTRSPQSYLTRSAQIPARTFVSGTNFFPSFHCSLILDNPMRLKPHVKTIVINLITTFILAVILEAALGYLLRHPKAIPGFLNSHYRQYYNAEDRSIFQVTDCAEWDPQLFYRFKPGTCDFTNREFDVRNNINSAGLRDDENSLDNPSIVMFGDSFTMGWGVPQENSFPDRLEEMCKQKVLNAGISSFGTAREMILLDKLGYGYINTVIIQYHSNDYEENLKSVRNNFVLPISPKKTYDSLKENIANRVKYFPFKYLKGISKSFVYSLSGRSEDETVSDTLEARAFLDILRHSNIDRIASRILVFKIDHGVNDGGFANALDVLLKEPQYAKLNITTVRLNGLLDKDDYFILDAHINEKGHEKVAAKLNEHVRVAPTSPVIARN
jgi:hypothetical protein